MNDDELEEIIYNAKNKKEEAVIILLEKYSKMIKKHSCINGKVDEDLKQDLILKTIEAIQKFEI